MKASRALRILINGDKSEERTEEAKARLADLAKKDTLDTVIADAEKHQAMLQRIDGIKKLKPFRQRGKGVQA